ncbi:type II toxin-antitoxin system RelE/ParE family toxin [Kaistella sp.]|uniref:type II toxin-antitoxin system RelE/ParE family toxin n=1 Tax=Kaistella sp. TaxID=2782235 RepID=UPI003C39D4F2
MIREIITFDHYFDDFIKTLNPKVVEKIEYVFDIIETQERISEKFVKHIENGLFEIRIEYQSNIYRIFFCFDEGKLVVLFNSFQKKTQKTLRKEIDKALKIMAEYYEHKRTQN